ncbi:TetR/AcrR family transcriptional regulator [Natronolimnobius baerhuensis]|uniref:HTH tetR-type domain-containing protein n=1 Tax=Natronolimnobius baerhuensis TaxID=253108 RepID=A0A202E845_9EURY|nr:TetR/AcrR family transcriptional regulator [Natronolimnobius baerhuensis]OVE84432.1 hypothetical protein B2G88_08460 [Natronolimnobius baerhuensis]
MKNNPFDDVDGTQAEILKATYQALFNHGYSELTIKRIGDQFDKSPSLIYHHYDDKDALVLACLEYLLESFESELIDDSIENPRERLEESIFWSVDPTFDAEAERFFTMMLELRARSTHDAAYRTYFERNDRIMHAYFVDVIQEGIETGVFREVDPDAVAETLLTLIVGAVHRRSSVESELSLDKLQVEVQMYLNRRLYKCT